MTLDEFIAAETERIKAFKQYWRAHSNETPALFPDSMESGEWDEMLHVFNKGEE